MVNGSIYTALFWSYQPLKCSATQVRINPYEHPYNDDSGECIISGGLTYSGDHVFENLSMNPPTYFSKPFKFSKIRLSYGISHSLCVNTSKGLHMVGNPTIVSYMNELL